MNERRQGNVELNEKITEIQIQLATISNQIKNDSESITKMIARHDITLYGDGNGEYGLTTKVDRLNQIEKKREHHGLVAWGSAIGLLLKTFWDHIAK